MADNMVARCIQRVFVAVLPFAGRASSKCVDYEVIGDQVIHLHG